MFIKIKWIKYNNPQQDTKTNNLWSLEAKHIEKDKQMSKLNDV